MKNLSYPLIAIAFAATAAQAQDTPAPPAEQDSAQPATPQTAPDQSTSPDSALPGAEPQDSLPPPDAGEPATPPADAAAPPSGPVASADVTDAEVSSYAQAATKVQEIAKNAALPDDAKQQQMASAVSEAGLEPQRFNEISQAIGADPELRARVQTAMAAHSAAHDG
jgi:hypothetical protein